MGLVLEGLRRGARLGPLSLRGRVWRGRFPEEWNIEVLVGRGTCLEPLFHVKVFTGRPPYYRPWVEIHTVHASACGASLDGVVEDYILDLAAAGLGPGERLYVEYEWDPLTSRELDLGVPPPLSRLGYKMLLRGFTWFKDWYYPEGFMEGGRKLEAEKPLDQGHARRHLEEIERQARDLLARGAPEGLEHVEARARGLLQLLQGGHGPA